MENRNDHKVFVNKEFPAQNKECSKVNLRLYHHYQAYQETLAGVLITLTGVPQYNGILIACNMSVSRCNKKIKPINPEEQPVI